MLAKFSRRILDGNHERNWDRFRTQAPATRSRRTAASRLRSWPIGPACRRVRPGGRSRISKPMAIIRKRVTLLDARKARPEALRYRPCHAGGSSRGGGCLVCRGGAGTAGDHGVLCALRCLRLHAEDPGERRGKLRGLHDALSYAQSPCTHGGFELRSAGAEVLDGIAVVTTKEKGGTKPAFSKSIARKRLTLRELERTTGLGAYRTSYARRRGESRVRKPPFFRTPRRAGSK